jgi:hypothetical protein
MKQEMIASPRKGKSGLKKKVTTLSHPKKINKIDNITFPQPRSNCSKMLQLIISIENCRFYTESKEKRY